MDDGRGTRDVTVKAPLYRQSAGVLSLRNERILVRVRDVVSRPEEALPFVLWQVDCPAD